MVSKVVIGDLSNTNKQLNFVPGSSFKSLEKKPYMEVGTGVNNILKFFSVDFVWRLTPQASSVMQSKRFGVFAGFKIGL